MHRGFLSITRFISILFSSGIHMKYRKHPPSGKIDYRYPFDTSYWSTGPFNYGVRKRVDKFIVAEINKISCFFSSRAFEYFLASHKATSWQWAWGTISDFASINACYSGLPFTMSSTWNQCELTNHPHVSNFECDLAILRYREQLYACKLNADIERLACGATLWSL